MGKKIFMAVSFSITAIMMISMAWYFSQKEQTYKSKTTRNDSLKVDTIAKVVVPAKDTALFVDFVSETGAKYNIELRNKTFLNNDGRNYYGDSLPARLDIIWQHFLGTGTTNLAGVVAWSGAGWTGQPLMVVENGTKYLIQGAYDHNLKKIRADSGVLVWQHDFGDVIKGTGTIWINHQATTLKEKIVILQGSRASGQSLATTVGSYRGVSYFTGEELWRLSSKKTHCYSRDVDASAIVVNDTAYLGLENGFFAVFDPNPARALMLDGVLQPKIHKISDSLYTLRDVMLHNRNIVTEASPTRLGKRVYLASGSGWVWGYNLETQTMDWKYYIGSDMDGSPVVTADSCLLIAVEKQYIAGKGGVLKINPNLDSTQNPVVWYFPTQDFRFADWQGGIIGSVSTNENYPSGKKRPMAAFTAIDGNMYVVATEETEPNHQVLLFDAKRKAATPMLVFKYQTGGAISTPIFVDNRLLVVTYNGTYLFEHDENYEFTLLAKSDIRGEATPFVDGGRIYVASRDGFLYCLGDSPNTKPLVIRPKKKK
jgi:outer membrane protein assembly factor BamB